MKKLFVLPMLTLAALSFGSLAATTSAPCGFPPRTTSSAAWSSDQFYRQYETPSLERELAVVVQVMLGNVPDRLRALVPLNIPATLDGKKVVIEIEVAPDYLMIGTNADAVRVPLTPFAAQYLAGKLGFVLPTTHLVDLIYANANTQLVPQPTNWYLNSPTMRLASNYLIFDQSIENQRAGRGGLIAGHKKDVVLTNLLDRAPNHVAIYGWQRRGNKPLQPLTTVHDYTYEDYSHGIRLIGPRVSVTTVSTGKVAIWSTVAALKDPALGALLNGGKPALRDLRATRNCESAFARSLDLAPAACPPQPRTCP